MTTPHLAHEYRIPTYRVTIVRDGATASPTRRIRSARDAYDVLARYLDGVDREHFVVALLNKKHEVIGYTPSAWAA